MSEPLDTSLEDKIRKSVAAIRDNSIIRPRVGIILGSGLGDFAKHILHQKAIPYNEIPYFPKLSAAGHAGELIVGYFGQLPVVAMRGRAHFYEGLDPLWATYGIRVMQALGAEVLVVSNAAGGVNPRFSVGDIVLIDSHIDLMFHTAVRPKDNSNEAAALGVVHRSDYIYDESLLLQAMEAARQSKQLLSRGTYLATLGPTYETRAEYRAFRMMGADMVGMSTVPETILAKAIGLQVLAFSVITNVAAPDATTATSHDEVLKGASTAQIKLVALLRQLFDQWSGPPD